MHLFHVSKGGWWIAKKFEDITGNVAIEITDRRYVSAMDNGTFRLGDPRDQGNLTRIIHDSIFKDRENTFLFFLNDKYLGLFC